MASSARRRFRLSVPRDFDLLAVVGSHGWYQLPPFAYHQSARCLQGVLRHACPRPLAWKVRQSGPSVLRIEVDRPLRPPARRRVVRGLSLILNLRVDLAPFHAHCRRHPHLRWVARRHLGRFLRGEDLWEDMAKTLLTTNCTWKQTVAMVGRLAALGEPVPGDPQKGERCCWRAFPAPAAVAALGERGLRQRLKVGYRARPLLELAQAATAGELEGLTGLGSEELFRRLRSFSGFGDYAASSLLALGGRCDRLVVDSWVLARARARFGLDRSHAAKDVRSLYQAHGEFRGLVAWFDLNRESYRTLPPAWLSQ